MKLRAIGCGAWLLIACCLYFFENQTATRIILAASLLMPVIPTFRRLFFSKDQAQAAAKRTVSRPIVRREEDGPDDLRPYVPGDPVNRIHWKLSAKRDELLFRQPDHSETDAEAAAIMETTAEDNKKSRLKRVLIGLTLTFLALLPLFIVPEINRSLQGLLNRLFEESERVNAYVYDRFPVSPEQSPLGALFCLSLALILYLAAAFLTGSRVMLFCAWAGCALFQVYFGLPLPGWLNAGFFAAFALCMASRPLTKKAALSLLGGLCLISLAVLLLLPGVDEPTEAASEKARDWLSQTLEQTAGVAAEAPDGELETRHTHTQTLTAGDREASPGRTFRLLTEEEAQISQPRWIDYLKIVLLLLLAVALLILPFLPFLLLNARRKKALKARQAFTSDNVNEAVCAIFQQVAAWLESTGHGGGNLPYVAWAERTPAGFKERFRQCALAFEEAAYSDRALDESKREAALALLSDVSQTLFQQADWKQKLRLKYKECLWP